MLHIIQINEVMNDDDILLTNIKVSFDGKNTELDNLIINVIRQKL